MQGLFTAWLALPILVIFASLFAFYLATAALLVWLSFRSPLRGRVQSFKGVVAPYFGSVSIIFGLLVAFLSNDIWDRNKQAERVVLTESDTLVALYSLSIASGSDSKALRSSIRGYASAVVEDEWPRHEDRLELANDRTAVTKWGAVLLLALITQLAIAVVHLEKPRPQAAALFIFTLAAVSLLGLLAIHEAPFEPPIFLPPGPIVDVLRQVPM
jgi:hypothetical protein